MIRRIVFLVTLVISVLVWTKPLFAQSELISSFHSNIIISEDATVTITETVLYDFGTERRHGIFRDVPVIYENTEGRKFRVSLSIQSVTDEEGRPYQYEVSSYGNDTRIKIGDPDKTVTGEHTYIITYTARGVITYFSDHDELYWNVTGNGWEVPIVSASAGVTVEGQPLSVINKADCFTGAAGARKRECAMSVSEADNVWNVAAGKPLGAGEGLTFVLSFPKDIVAVVEPEPVNQGLHPFVIVAMVALFATGYILLPAWLFFHWRRAGRDPKIDPTIVRVYDPPKDKNGRILTPLQVGALVDEMIHPRDISGEIIHLAVRKYLVIKEQPKKLLGLAGGDIEFMRGQVLKTDSDLREKKPLRPHQQTIIEAIELDRRENVTIKDLKNKLPERLKKLEKQVYEEMVREGFFPENPEKVRTKYLVFGVIAVFTLNFFLAALLFFFSRVMPRRTLAGAEAKRYALGLKEFLVSQERELEFQEENYFLFEKLLPYAIVFGVAKIWAGKFAHITKYQPDWYQSSGGRVFTPMVLTNRLEKNLASMQASYTPTRSSSGFSSGFSGGSSGGGFGGGGGGSW
ncbi:MAG TPA: DUF2207 domain-containing protein [Patescibacteria group bacterium]|nr:DUF2207 domain-containing protein [Patescibacteria group bacterium]